jgi:hypothetical protein
MTYLKLHIYSCCLLTVDLPVPIFLNFEIQGKNKESVNFPGSVRFRDVVDSFALRYAKATNKFEKMSITKQIYEQVSKKARFLKYNEAEETWEEISMMAARDKIGHSLRFAGRAKRRMRKIHKRSTSVSSSSSSDNSDVGQEMIFRSLLDQMKQGIFGPEIPSASMSSGLTFALPPLTGAIQMMENMQQQQEQENESPDEQFDATELLKLLQEDQANANPLVDFADNIRQVIQNIGADKSNDETYFSLMSEPLGEWEDQAAMPVHLQIR